MITFTRMMKSSMLEGFSQMVITTVVISLIFFPHGQGKYWWMDGCMYVGDWFRGKTMGKGIFMALKGNVRGQFQDWIYGWRWYL